MYNEKICVICNKIFIPYRSIQQTCSLECRKKHISKHKKNYYQENKQSFKLYNKKNKDKIKKNRQMRYQINKEHESLLHKQWYLKNRESEIASAKKRMNERYRLNPIKINEYNRLQYYKHRKARLLQQKQYYSQPEVKLQHAKIAKIYRIKNREYQQQKQLEWAKKYPEKRLKIMQKHLKKIASPYKMSHGEFQWALYTWSQTVKKIYGVLCAICDSPNHIDVHHILHKSKYPELSLNTNNGIPLCKIHHNEVHGRKLI